jgi:uncharacterized tellurite resistance protein B-like protein
VSSKEAVNSSMTAEASWYFPGQLIPNVAGESVAGGMLYVGAQLSPVDPRYGRNDPALVDRSAPVQWKAPSFEAFRPVRWTSYADLDSAGRAAYLNWLRGGRTIPDVPQSCLFLFFFGLERRLLFDRVKGQVGSIEENELLAEVRGLADRYPYAHDFQGYSRRLLEFLAMRSRSGMLLKPPTVREGPEIPLAVRLKIGRFISAKEPIPAEWAFAWMIHHPETRLRTSAQRCPELFRDLFLIRFGDTFEETSGLKVSTRPKPMTVIYRPANPSFNGPVSEVFEDLRDISELRSPLEPLWKLADAVAEELDPYSRWISRTEQESGLSALALLPAEIGRHRELRERDHLRSFAREALDGPERGKAEAAALRALWPPSGGGAWKKKDAELLARVLEQDGIGIEPDVRYDGNSVVDADYVFFFRSPWKVTLEASDGYRWAALLLRLGVSVAVSDDNVADREKEALAVQLEQALHLPKSDVLRLQAHLQWLLAERPSLTKLRKRLAGTTSDERKKLAHFLLALAGADGEIHAAELKTLRKIYGLLELDAQALYSDLHDLSARSQPPAKGPVSVGRPAPGQAGFSIPVEASNAPVQRTFRLDAALVAASIAETEKTADLLGALFLDEPEPMLPAPLPPKEQDSFAVHGLDSIHSALAMMLASRPQWARLDLDRMAAQVGLMPDGALEAINAAAIEKTGSTALEDGDTVDVDQEILKELVQ